jgi:hypothetical protein
MEIATKNKFHEPRKVSFIPRNTKKWTLDGSDDAEALDKILRDEDTVHLMKIKSSSTREYLKNQDLAGVKSGFLK